jgi:lipopolysaccharide export LptBFGC system permease protein LptF
MKLEEGFRDENNPDQINELYRLNFKVFFIDIPINENKTEKIDKKPADMTLQELRRKITDFDKKGIDTKEFNAEFHQRISFSLSVLTFIILGFGTSLVVRHREKAINFGIAFLIAGVYYLLFILGETLIEYNLMIPWLGMWIPNIIIGSLGIWLVYKNAHFR